MANYIHTLKSQIEDMESRHNALHATITRYRQLLLSPKHQGVDADGNRNDWVASSDALRMLDEIQNALQCEPELSY